LLFVSVIRDPIERLLSEYFWWVKHCERERAWSNQLCQGTKDARPGLARLEAWVKSPHNNAANRLTKMFSHLDDVEAPGPTEEHCVAYDATKQGTYWSKRYGKSYEEGLEAAINTDDALVENAINNIEVHFGFVGIQAFAQDSLALFAHLLDPTGKAAVDPPRTSLEHSHASSGHGGKKLAATKAEALASELFIAEVRARNRLDVRLYAHVAARFNATFHSTFNRAPSQH
jgi:hypothetical protein